METPWQPYREPLSATITRTVAIAVVAAAVVAFSTRGCLARWPVLTLLFLWPSFGGHWVDVFFLNYLRPRLPPSRGVQVGARLLVWLIGGTLLIAGMVATAMAFPHAPPAWRQVLLFGGVAFIGIELLAHLVLQLRGRPSFYNGRG
jgi:hypothetical protein